MKAFRYDLQEHVPALAWLLKVGLKTDDVTVKHGTAVECHDDFFAAGVWAGEFGKGEIDTAPYACCSGGCLRQMGGVNLWS